EELLLDTLAIALVIAAETLVSTRELGREFGDEIDGDRELLAYAAANTAAALFGSSPVIGSLSRTNRAVQLGVTSQWMSVSAFAVTGLLLLFAAPLMACVPVPVLTGIVIAALLTIMEFPLAVRLWKLDRSSAFIFTAAFATELLGLAEGVLVGVFLSFAFFTMRSSAQPSYFLGRLEGQEGFFDLAQTPDARPLRGTVLYQFNGPLFYATEEDFEREILSALKPDTRLVVVTGVTGVFFFAADRLTAFYRDLKGRGISLYLVGQAAAVAEQLSAYGAEDLVREGAVLPRLTEALEAGGLRSPYPLDER
ncbi:MAG: SulP family inorganic anion transporter, partial [Oscillibacter sp.]|nr:SulP family inorganic anion transporter [Oscillibacter sp.]